ncbi:hypothetical protein HDE_08368 [Halotydeus destructor]|nr:hypothetical protein HDE_08368 [Halotydeus destructor]
MRAYIVAIVLIVSSIDIHGAKKVQIEDHSKTAKCTETLEHKQSNMLFSCGFCEVDVDYESRSPEIKAEADERCRLGCQLLKKLPHGNCFSIDYRDRKGDICSCVSEKVLQHYKRMNAQ